jgi:hypothetical protein
VLRGEYETHIAIELFTTYMYVCAVNYHCLGRSRSILADLPFPDKPQQDRRGVEYAFGSSILPVRRAKRLEAETSWSGVIVMSLRCTHNKNITRAVSPSFPFGK